MHHLNYDQLPAEALFETAQKAGYIYKQGKGGSQCVSNPHSTVVFCCNWPHVLVLSAQFGFRFYSAFQKRWFVLWHHPASVEDGWCDLTLFLPHVCLIFASFSPHIVCLILAHFATFCRALLWFDDKDSQVPNKYKMLKVGSCACMPLNESECLCCREFYFWNFF